jgi:hypothetical protein
MAARDGDTSNCLLVATIYSMNSAGNLPLKFIFSNEFFIILILAEAKAHL